MKNKKIINLILNILFVTITILIIVVFSKPNNKEIKSYNKITKSEKGQYKQVCYKGDCTGFFKEEDNKLITYNNKFEKLGEFEILNLEKYKNNIIGVGNKFLITYMDNKYSVHFQNGKSQLLQDFVGNTDNYFIGKINSQYEVLDSEFKKLKKPYKHFERLSISNTKYFRSFNGWPVSSSSIFMDENGKVLFGENAIDKNKNKFINEKVADNLFIMFNKEDNVIYKEKKYYRPKLYLYDLKENKKISDYFTDYSFMYESKTNYKEIILTRVDQNLKINYCKVFNIKTKSSRKCDESDQKLVNVDYDNLSFDFAKKAKLEGTKNKIYYYSVKSQGQEALINYNESKRTCGIYDISSAQELLKINDGECLENYKFGFDTKNKHYIVVIPKTKTNKSFVYDLFSKRIIYEADDDYNIVDYMEYDDDYKTVLLEKNNNYKSIIYRKGKKQEESEQDKYYLYGSTSPSIVYNNSYNLYTTFINLKTKERIKTDYVYNFKISKDNYFIFEDRNYIYLLNRNKSKITKKIKGQINRITNNEIIYFNKTDKKVGYIDINNHTGSYNFKDGEEILISSQNKVGISEGHYLINNKTSSYVLNSRQRKIHEFKDSTITNIFPSRGFIMLELENNKNKELTLVRLEK